MSSQTRWDKWANTNELVDVVLEWDFNGGADLVRHPMIVDGIDQSASIQGTAVRAITYDGVPGFFTAHLKDPYPWLLSDSLKVTASVFFAGAPATVKATTDLDYQDATDPRVRLQVFDAAGAPVNPTAGNTLRGTLTFRNRRVGS
jgi:hypothetical protein